MKLNIPFVILCIVFITIMSFIFSDFGYKYFNHNDNMSNLMQNVGLAFITILIPYAIAILVDILQRQKDDEGFAKLDLHLVLDYIFKIKIIVIYIVLIFIPPFFWEVSAEIGRVILETFWAIGIFFLLRILISLYKWTKGNTLNYRFEYLKSLDNEEDMEVVWQSVWKSRSINIQNEFQYFEIFEFKINALLTNLDINGRIISRIFNDFILFKDNRSLELLSRDYPKILKWRKVIWEYERSIENE